MTALNGPRATIERAADHTRAAQVTTVLVAFLIGSYAAWLGGDFGLGPGSLVGFGVVTAWVLVQQPTTRAIAARGCYLLAALIAGTPVFLNLPLLASDHGGIQDPAALVFHPGVYVFAIGFVVIGTVLVGIGIVLEDDSRPIQ